MEKIREIVRNMLMENFDFGDLDDYDKNEYDEFRAQYESYYEFVDEVDDELKELVHIAVNNFKRELPLFPKIKINFVKNFDTRGDAIGMYIYESVLRFPIILLSEEAIYQAYQEGYDLDTIILPTIYHELGHAMADLDTQVEYVEGENLLNFEDEEQFVEDFAFNFYNFGKIDDEFKKFSDIVIKNNSEQS